MGRVGGGRYEAGRPGWRGRVVKASVVRGKFGGDPVGFDVRRTRCSVSRPPNGMPAVRHAAACGLSGARHLRIQPLVQEVLIGQAVLFL